ncbi:MAG: FAA hydrolase family protein [Solirubrobacterales bacterium]|nr:FAA hydrolase family protein [Solirubrobacterales bacterium]
MRIYQVENGTGRATYATVEGDRLLALEEGRPTEARAAVPALGQGRHELLGRLEDARLLAPVRPTKIVAIGLNYQDHIDETGLDPPKEPLVFAKFPSSLTGPYDPIRFDPALTERVDWEVELGVVIGSRMRDVPAADALEGVFGYTVANDVSARDLQFHDVQWVRGKSLDSFCPVGPAVVTTDEVPDPQDLSLRTKVNGEVVQESSTRLMLFGIAELLEFCSRSFTLEPGDLLLTGTPWGCGEFTEPKRSLQDGDIVETEIDGIGAMRNEVVAGPQRPPSRLGSADGRR